MGKTPEQVAAEARRPYVTAHHANIARFRQLADDASKKIANDQAADAEHLNYWGGFRDGLFRAVEVLEGRG